MKYITLTIVFFGFKSGLLAQDFKQFQPKKEPFKVFELPKFPQIIVKDSLVNERIETKVEFSRFDKMPVLKIDNFKDSMPILKPNNTIKYTLLSIDPFKNDNEKIQEK